MSRFDAYEDLVGRWRWRLLGGEGQAVATSGESFETHWHALRAAESVRGAASAATICGTPGDGADDPLAVILRRELSAEPVAPGSSRLAGDL